MKTRASNLTIGTTTLGRMWLQPRYLRVPPIMDRSPAKCPTVKGFSCWIILVQHVGRDSNYASVRMWVTKEGNGLLRAEAFNAKGKLEKRFEVISGQRVEDKWIPKQVRVQVYNPESGKPESRTYLEINS